MAEGKLYRIFSRAFLIVFSLIAFGAIYSYNTGKQIKVFTLDSPLLFPVLVGLLLAICIVVDWLKDRKQYGGQGKEPVSSQEKRGILVVLAVFAAAMIYVLLLKTTHFVIGTIIFASLFMMYLNNTVEKINLKLAAKAILYSTGFVLIVYYVFGIVFRVYLP